MGTIKEQVEGLYKSKTEADDQKREELAYQLQCLEKVIKDFYERERREFLKRIVSKEGAKLLTIQTAVKHNPPPLAPTTPVQVVITPERTALVSTYPIPAAIRFPNCYRHDF